MKQTMKRALSLALALALSVTLLLPTVWAEGGSIPFSARVGETELTDISYAVDGYEYYDYSAGTTKKVGLYTITVPVNTSIVSLDFGTNSYELYNYDGSGNYISSSSTASAVVTDADGNTVFDYIQVQNPYTYDEGGNWIGGGELQYVVTFQRPFAVKAGEELLTDISCTVNAYTYTDYYENKTTVDVYTVTIPDSVLEVSLEFQENYILYNYSKDGTYLYGYSDIDWQTGTKNASGIKVDADGDAKPDYIQVQTPYINDGNNNYNSALLYAITFQYEGDSETPDETPAETVTVADVRSNIAHKYAAVGVASDSNSYWLAADMMAYMNTYPATANKLSGEQKQAMVDKAIDTIETSSAPSDLAKSIIALVSMGYDPAQLTTTSMTLLDGVAKLKAMVNDASNAAVTNYYTLPYVLIALQQFGSTYQTEIDILIASACEQTASWTATTYGTDAATPMMLALAPYYSTNERVKIALDTAKAAVKACQTEDGSLGGYGPAASTGLAIAAFVALGEDPAEIKNEETGKSLVDGLLAYTAENQDGFEPTANSFATEQGFRGLIALANVQNDTLYYLYDFSGQTLIPAKATRASINFKVIPSDAIVEVRNGEEQDQTPISTNAYDLSAGTYTYTVSKEGYTTKTGEFTVSEEEVSNHTAKTISVSLVKAIENTNITVSVSVMVPPEGEDGQYTYKHDKSVYSNLLGSSVSVELAKGSSARDALIEALDSANLSYVEQSDGYFSIIGDYSEFDHGPNSGWLYMVNGSLPDVAAQNYYITSNATMTWFYTDDYTNEYGSESVSQPAEETPVTTTTTTANSDGTITVTVTQGKETLDSVSGGVKVELPNKGGAGDVVVLVNKDGSETILTKSLVEGESAYALLDGTCTVKIIDNAKDFTDVSDTAWYADAVDFVSSRELYNGTGNGAFSPDVSMSRAMLATVLYRLESEPDTAIRTLDAFADGTSVSDWAQGGVAWAVEQDILQGVGNDCLAAGEAITREQLATMVYRYAKLSGMDVTVSDFTAVSGQGVSAWAETAMAWAVENGIIEGKNGGTLAPQDIASRAEVAAVLQRLVAAMVK